MLCDECGEREVTVKVCSLRYCEKCWQELLNEVNEELIQKERKKLDTMKEVMYKDES